MKTLKSLIRYHRGILDERRRDLVALESRRAEIEAARRAMEGQLLIEQKVAGGGSEVAFGYSPFARAVLGKRAAFADKISAIDLEIVEAVASVSEAFQEVKRYETALENHQRRLRVEIARRHQAELDEVGLTIHRRKEAAAR